MLGDMLCIITCYRGVSMFLWPCLWWELFGGVLTCPCVCSVEVQIYRSKDMAGFILEVSCRGVCIADWLDSGYLS